MTGSRGPDGAGPSTFGCSPSVAKIEDGDQLVDPAGEFERPAAMDTGQRQRHLEGGIRPRLALVLRRNLCLRPRPEPRMPFLAELNAPQAGRAARPASRGPRVKPANSPTLIAQVRSSREKCIRRSIQQDFGVRAEVILQTPGQTGDRGRCGCLRRDRLIQHVCHGVARRGGQALPPLLLDRISFIPREAVERLHKNNVGPGGGAEGSESLAEQRVNAGAAFLVDWIPRDDAHELERPAPAGWRGRKHMCVHQDGLDSVREQGQGFDVEINGGQNLTRVRPLNVRFRLGRGRR